MPFGKKRRWMMIRHESTVQIPNGKFTQAIQWAIEFVKFVKKYKGMPDIEVYTNLSGDGFAITYVSDYKDYSGLQKVGDQMNADPEYMKRIEGAADLYISGSQKVTLLRKVTP
jgi:hypothetical protein